MSVAPLSPQTGARPDSRTRPGERDAGASGAFQSLLARSTAASAHTSGPRGARPGVVARTEHPADRPADQRVDSSAGDDAGRPARDHAGRPALHGVEHGAEATRRVGDHRVRSGAGRGSSRRVGVPSDSVPASSTTAPATPAVPTPAASTPAAPSAPLVTAAISAGPVVTATVLPLDSSVVEAGTPASAGLRGAEGPVVAGVTSLGGFLARTTAGRAPAGGATAPAAAAASTTAPAATTPAGGTEVSAPATGHGSHRAEPEAAGTVATDLAATAPATGQALTGQAARAGARSSSRSGDQHDGPATSGAAGGTTAGGAAAPVPGARTGETAGPQQAQAAANPVLDQVLTVVPRLVQRGDGTSRLTLKLHPADLGEVHVTVTVKGGTVDVTLAAGARAKEALGTGSDRLRGLLESLGHTSGQVVVRDLVGAGVAGSSSTSGQSWGQSGQQPQQSSQQSSQQPQQSGHQGDASFAGAGGAPGDGSRPGADAHTRHRLPDSGPVAAADDVRADLGPRRPGRAGPTGPAGLDVTI
jgi:flagellar hook-length control protein FliK